MGGCVAGMAHGGRYPAFVVEGQQRYFERVLCDVPAGGLLGPPTD